MRRITTALRIGLLASAMTATALVGAAGATTSAGMRSVEELTTLSDLVVRGTVQSITSFEDGNGIFTDIDVSVQETLKGAPSTTTAVLRLYGGVYAGRRITVMGAPCFSTGEDVVLFLKARGAGAYNVVELAEGKFEVVQRVDGPSVRRDLRDIAYLGVTAPPAIPETLDELRAGVIAASR